MNKKANKLKRLLFLWNDICCKFGSKSKLSQPFYVLFYSKLLKHPVFIYRASFPLRNYFRTNSLFHLVFQVMISWWWSQVSLWSRSQHTFLDLCCKFSSIIEKKFKIRENANQMDFFQVRIIYFLRAML